LVQEVLRGYKATSHSSDSVFQRLSQVRARGRKRECFG
jgi:TP53 regulating kinase and related kinases